MLISLPYFGDSNFRRQQAIKRAARQLGKQDVSVNLYNRNGSLTLIATVPSRGMTDRLPNDSFVFNKSKPRPWQYNKPVTEARARRLQAMNIGSSFLRTDDARVNYFIQDGQWIVEAKRPNNGGEFYCSYPSTF
jgi:hypothetical protein